MSRLQRKTCGTAASGTVASLYEPTPLEFFLQADVPTTRLIEHGADQLKELHSWGDELGICYRKGGKIVGERVTRLGMLELGYRLGWTPCLEEDEGRVTSFFGFNEAMYFDEDPDGVLWQIAEGCGDDETGMPLHFSKRKRKAILVAYEAECARLRAEGEAQRQVNEERRRSLLDAQVAASTERMAELLSARCVRKGTAATVEEALPRCREAVRSALADLRFSKEGGA